MVSTNVVMGTEREIGCRFEGKATGRLPELALPGREYTHKSGYSRPPSSPAQFPLAACFRQALRSRNWNSGERRVYTSVLEFSCAAFQRLQFFSEFYRFSQRGWIAVLVRGEDRHSQWLCRVTLFQSYLASHSVWIIWQGAVNHTDGCNSWPGRGLWACFVSLPGEYLCQGAWGCVWLRMASQMLFGVHLISLSHWPGSWVIGYLIWVDFVSHSPKPLRCVCLYAGMCIFGAFGPLSPWVWDLCVGLCSPECEISELLFLGPNLDVFELL